MAADGLAPCITRTVTAMVLNIQDKYIPVFHEEGFPMHCTVGSKGGDYLIAILNEFYKPNK